MKRIESRGRIAPKLCALAALLALATGGCFSGPAREPIQMPAVASLRVASGVLLEEVERREAPPEWIDRARVDEGVIYGVGIRHGRGNAERDLFLAMQSARRAVVVWLEARGAAAETPRGLLPPLAVEEDEIRFERLAHDTKKDRWYALARLPIQVELDKTAAAVTDIERTLLAAQLRVADSGAASADRIRSALAILYALDRRQQLYAYYHALSGANLPVPAGLEDVTMQAWADTTLSRHGVRVIVEGVDVPGLYESVRSAMGEVHLQSDEFGRGLIAIRIFESDGFGPGNPYLEVDGHVEMAIDGGDARTYSTPFHVVSSGVSADEARFRAARSINEEVVRIVRETLRTMGQTGS